MREQVFVCSGCGRPIYEEESYTEFFGEQYCQRCVKKHTRKAVKVEREPDPDQLLLFGEQP